MNEANDPMHALEAELSALRPHDGSPELRARLAACRARDSGIHSRWIRRGLLVGGLAAASLAAAIHFGWVLGPRDLVRPPTASRIPTELETTREVSQRALGVHEFIFARSSEELDSFLNQTAGGTFWPDLQGTPQERLPSIRSRIQCLARSKLMPYSKLLMLFLPITLLWPAAANAQTPDAKTDLAANAALKYWQAFAQMPALTKEQAKLLERWKKVPLDEEVLKLIAASEKSRVYLYRGAKLTRCEWSIDFDDGMGLVLTHHIKARDLAHLAALHARHELRRVTGKLEWMTPSP